MASLCTRDLHEALRVVDGIDHFRLEVEKDDGLAGPDAVRNALQTSGAQEGWLLFTDRVVTVREALDGLDLSGTPLDAELLLEDGASLHLTHQQDGQWRLRILRRVEDPEAVGTVRRLFQRGTDGHRRLVYELGWELGSDAFGHSVLRPAQTRFAGFVEGED